MKQLISILAAIAYLLAPFASIPAHAVKRAAPVYSFCPEGALAGSYAAAYIYPAAQTGDTCLSAPQPGVLTGATAGFQLANCWAGGGAGAVNLWNGTTTDYGAANSSPITVSTPFNDPGCAYPVGAYTPVSQMSDPAVAPPSDCTYSATGSSGGGSMLTCTPNYSVSGSVRTYSQINFGAVGGHGCTALKFNTVSGAVTSVIVANSNFRNDTGNCTTTGTQTQLDTPDAFGASLKLINDTFDGNGQAFSGLTGSCAGLTNANCNVQQAFGTGFETIIAINCLFLNYAGRTEYTVTSNGADYILQGDLFLGAQTRGFSHGEFDQTYGSGTRHHAQVKSFVSWMQTTGSISTWDAVTLTTYTDPAWDYVLIDHNIFINGTHGMNNGGQLTGCSIAAGTSTLSCTGVTGGRVGSGTQMTGAGCDGGFLELEINLTGGTSAGPGGSAYVDSASPVASTWGLQNFNGTQYFMGSLDNGSGTGTPSGSVLTVTTQPGPNQLIPNQIGGIVIVGAFGPSSPVPTAWAATPTLVAGVETLSYTSPNTNSFVEPGQTVSASSFTGVTDYNFSSQVVQTSGSTPAGPCPSNVCTIVINNPNGLTQTYTGSVGQVVGSTSVTLQLNSQLTGATGDVGTYAFSNYGTSSPQAIANATIHQVILPGGTGQWAVLHNVSCGTVSFLAGSQPMVNIYMGHGGNETYNNGIQFTGNLFDFGQAYIFQPSIGPWDQEGASPTPPACLANDIPGNNGVDASSIFGNNYDMGHHLANANQWGSGGFTANGCGS